ncbi:hypothetical protein HY623_00615 [Candidatus Uhrbacteria bacterium]|nr:hypothetical protein [Candidatus Uhrbacteria bacterium]
MEMGSGTDFAVAKTEQDPISIGFSVTQIVSSSRGRAFARASPADVTVAGFLVKGENTMASSIGRFFSVAMVLAVATGGCDKDKVGVSSSARGTGTLSPKPSLTPKVGASQAPAPHATSPSTAPSSATPTIPDQPIPSPSPTGPWATGKLVAQGNGLQMLEITGSGGFAGFRWDERTDIFAMSVLDGEVYVLVYRWWFHISEARFCHTTPKIYNIYNAPSGGAVFRLVLGGVDDEVQFKFVRKQNVEVDALRAGYTAGEGCGWSTSETARLWVLESLWQTMPATQAYDVAMLSPAASPNVPARLSAQAEGRWGSDSLTTEGLPWYPGNWYPNTGPLMGSGYTRTIKLVAGVKLDHGVGFRSAFAFRYKRYNPRNPPLYSYGYGEEKVPGADDGPLWRLNKGEAAWRPLTVIPWGGDDQGSRVPNIWNNVLWSDVHKRWFFWIGSATGSVYVATEESAAKLR